MKIVLNDINDVEDFLRILSPSYFRLIQKATHGMDVMAGDIAGPCTPDDYARARDVEGVKQQLESGHISAAFAAAELAARGEPEGLPADIAQPQGVATTNEPGPVDTDERPERDGDGSPYNTDWHSDPAKINADGRWRARRKRDEDAYKVWLLEVTTAAEADPTTAEPVATETHALPQDESDVQEGGPGVTEPLPEAGPTVDLAALVEASQEAALDASDSHMDLIKACQQYIEAHGHPAYNALKAAVAPLEGSDNGKAIPQFTPGERRLMRACMANYPTT